MLSRRKVLLMSLAAAIAPNLSACGWFQTPILSAKILKGSIPPQLLGQFQDRLSGAVNLDPISQFTDIYDFLASAKETTTVDLVTLGDFWLKRAIQEQLIQPIPVKELSNWHRLTPRWQALGKRDDQGNLAPEGNIWGIPYRWGSTVIAYREDKFRDNGDQPPTDWQDLWRDSLRDRISLLNHPREVIGLTLKKLGESYNTNNLQEVPNLKSELAALQQQVKFYSSQAYLQPLILGDTWLAVGWLTDFLQLQTRYPDIKIIIPSSGTALWADLWVRPAVRETFTKTTMQWMDFSLEPKSAVQIGLFSDASSPILLNQDAHNFPDEFEKLRNDPLRNPSEELIKKSEFLHPLPSETEQQYQTLWEQMRKNQL